MQTRMILGYKSTLGNTTTRFLFFMTLHSERVTVWCALSSIWIFSPVFINKPVSSDVSSLCAAAFQEGYDTPSNSAWLQQDGARPQTSNATLLPSQRFSRTKSCQTISCTMWGRICMATNLKDLKFCDYFLWGYFKDRVFQKNPHTIPELKTAIQSDSEAITSEILTKTLKNFVHCMHTVRNL